mgnify:CR=1 FL=1
MTMKPKDERLDDIVQEYVWGVDDYMANLSKLMSYPCFNSDDMRQLSQIAYELSEFADNTASEFDEVVEQ